MPAEQWCGGKAYSTLTFEYPGVPSAQYKATVATVPTITEGSLQSLDWTGGLPFLH